VRHRRLPRWPGDGGRSEASKAGHWLTTSSLMTCQLPSPGDAPAAEVAWGQLPLKITRDCSLNLFVADAILPGRHGAQTT
jgi:hypothetical protein